MKYLGWETDSYLAELHIQSIRRDFEKTKSPKSSSLFFYKKHYGFIFSILRSLQQLF